MEIIDNITKFKNFLKENREEILQSAISSDEIKQDDEWMEEDQWDEIYNKEVTFSGKV